MAGEWRYLLFNEAVEINPPVSLEPGHIYPFVEMQAIDPHSRTVRPSEYREFKGSGSRFTDGDTLMARITPCLENGKIARFHSDERLCLLPHLLGLRASICNLANDRLVWAPTGANLSF